MGSHGADVEAPKVMAVLSTPLSQSVYSLCYIKQGLKTDQTRIKHGPNTDQIHILSQFDPYLFPI